MLRKSVKKNIVPEEEHARRYAFYVPPQIMAKGNRDVQAPPIYTSHIQRW